MFLIKVGCRFRNDDLVLRVDERDLMLPDEVLLKDAPPHSLFNTESVLRLYREYCKGQKCDLPVAGGVDVRKVVNRYRVFAKVDD